MSNPFFEDYSPIVTNTNNLENLTIDVNMLIIIFLSNFQNITKDDQMEKKPNETNPNETKPNETNPSETKSNETKSNDTKPNETKPKFTVLTPDVNSSGLIGNTSTNVSVKKQCGRKRLKEEGDIHDKFSTDNIYRKVQTHCISSVTNLANEIIKQLGYNFKFHHIKYDFKKIINSAFVEELKKMKLSDILCQEPSGKYKEEKDYNSNIYKKIEENKIFQKLFGIDYQTYYETFYIPLSHDINLEKYGLKVKIKSDIIKTFDHLVNDQLKKTKNEEYINKLIKVACRDINRHLFINCKGVY